MKSAKVICTAAIALLALLAIPIPLAAQKQIRYTVTDLGTLGGTFSQAFGINNKGSVVGFATLAGDTALHAFLWHKGVMTDLSTLAPTDTLAFSAAFSINDNDEAVGLSETSVPDPQNTCGDSLVCLSVLWRDGLITALPTLGGTDGQASAINNRGQVVGIAQSDKIDPMCQTPVLKPTAWERGQARALPTAPLRDGIVGGAPGPAGNNNRGQVVGISTTCDFSSTRTLLWEKNKVIDMGTIGGLVLVPVALNDKGQAVGTYTTTAGVNHAFLWQDGVATDLGTIAGDDFAEGSAINDRGQVVGQSCHQSGFPNCSVFLWQDGVMADLNLLLPADSSLHTLEAGGITSGGGIVGLAIQKTTGELHAFLAMPSHGEVAGESATSATAGESSQRPRVVLTERFRKMLQQRLGSRYHIPGLGTAKN
jgi:probable HAF family extracellular repeat protein